VRPHHGLEFKTGVLASLTRGHENFSTVDIGGNPGPASNSSLKGSDVGVYAQTAISPSDRWELRTGVRSDNHNAPFAGNKHQVSPRVKLSFFPTGKTRCTVLRTALPPDQRRRSARDHERGRQRRCDRTHPA